MGYYHIEGFQDCSMYKRNNYGLESHTWDETPCTYDVRKNFEDFGHPLLPLVHISRNLSVLFVRTNSSTPLPPSVQTSYVHCPLRQNWAWWQNSNLISVTLWQQWTSNLPASEKSPQQHQHNPCHFQQENLFYSRVPIGRGREGERGVINQSCMHPPSAIFSLEKCEENVLPH